MITRILSYLLHHANRESRSEAFYKVKDKILARYGKVIGHDVQHISGKTCFTCNGTGEPLGMYEDDDDHCTRCWGDGWYKRPKWILLERIRFGRYIFHKPIYRTSQVENLYHEYNSLPSTVPIIEGYISHDRSKHGKKARILLFILFDLPGYLKRFWSRLRSSIPKVTVRFSQPDDLPF